MTKTDAHRLLDDARAGLPISLELVNLALQSTGDLEPDPWPVARRIVPVGSWETTPCALLRPAQPFDGLFA